MIEPVEIKGFICVCDNCGGKIVNQNSNVVLCFDNTEVTEVLSQCEWTVQDGKTYCKNCSEKIEQFKLK